MNQIDTEITVYGTTWCGSTTRMKKFFEKNQVVYKWVDIEKDETAAHFVESNARGFRSVPTIVFPDGSILVEPAIKTVAEKLGIPIPSDPWSL